MRSSFFDSDVSYLVEVSVEEMGRGPFQFEKVLDDDNLSTKKEEDDALDDATDEEGN